MNMQRRHGLTGIAISVSLVLSMSSCGGGNRASVEKMLDQTEPKKVASNIESILKKLENPKNKIMPDPRCAMMSVAVELADRARDFAPDENTGEAIVSEEQYTRLLNVLVNEIDNPGIYYKERTLSKKGYHSATVEKHLSSWAAYELANSEFGGSKKLNRMLSILGNSSYGGYDLAWQRAAAFNTIKQIDLVKSNKFLQLQSLNATHNARVIAGLPNENMNSNQAELDHLLGVIDSHILNLPLMNESLKSLRNNKNSDVVVSAIRRNYRLLDRLLDTGINDVTLQRHLYENIELLRHYAFQHENDEVHIYARNTLVRFAPFTYLDSIIASEDQEKKKRWVQESIQILPVMDAYMKTMSPEDLEVFALPSFTKAVVQLEGRDKERDAHKRVKENAKDALAQLDKDIKKAEEGESLLPIEPKAETEEQKLFLAFEDVSAQIINPALYFPVNKFASKRQNFLDQTFSMLLSYKSEERQFLLSELYKQEPAQLLNYLSNNLEAEHKAGQDYALQDMLILGNLGQDKRLDEKQQALARESAVWFLTKAYDGGNIQNLVEAGMQFIYKQHPMTLAQALRTGFANFNELSKEAAWDYAKAYTASLQQAITLTDADKSGARPEEWKSYLDAFAMIHDRWDFRPFTQCIPFLLEENPNVLIDIVLVDKPLQQMKSTVATVIPTANTDDTDKKDDKNTETEEISKEDLLDPTKNHNLLVARVLILVDVLKRAKPKITKEQWDKAINFMLVKFTESTSEDLDYALARGLIELERENNKPSAKVVKTITAKYPGFALIAQDMEGK